MRLEGKTALVIGGGQTPGETIGNGRAMAALFARQGAKVVVGDRDPESAQQTVEMIEAEGGAAAVQTLDVTDDGQCAAAIAACVQRFGRLDVLVNNVGIGTGDGGVTRITDEAWDLIYEVNLKGALHACRHALPVMREQGSGVILNISSIASICAAPLVAYKSSKAALNAFTHTLATGNAKYGIRANAILPGLMNTPMAIEAIAAARGISREALIAERDRMVPLRGGMGSAWDVAHAALFLASDEARFVSGVLLPVDGGQSARIG
ncbi:MAG: SDR family NAD(P)-dependent oxidoreductase [Myxococcales bacterium]|jgi:NAD(P)-dependent dehydrogenase (short-subunit alcohol dehydrogenase family)